MIGGELSLVNSRALLISLSRFHPPVVSVLFICAYLLVLVPFLWLSLSSDLIIVLNCSGIPSVWDQQPYGIVFFLNVDSFAHFPFS